MYVHNLRIEFKEKSQQKDMKCVLRKRGKVQVLGSSTSRSNLKGEEINTSSQISGNVPYHLVQNITSYSLLSKNNNIKKY